MAANDIKEKLQNIVLDGSFATTEMSVVYFLVEIRKLLEKGTIDKNDFRYLQFFCDWIVHTCKDRFLDTVTPFLDSLEKEIKGEINNEWKEFINFKNLENDLYNIAEKRELILDIDKLKSGMKEFERNLGNVLVNQPMITKDHYIQKFEILGIREYMIYFRITAAQVVTTVSSFQYASVYNKDKLTIELVQ